MAVLLNIISSGARKSAGASTFRRVRGRTIMSQKRGGLSASAVETRAAAGIVRSYREALFFIMANFAAGMAESINASFEPTKYGSPRNAFFKLNYSAVEKAVNASPLGLALLDQIMHEQNFTGVEVSDVLFDGFTSENFSQIMSAAGAAGAALAWVRSTIDGKVMQYYGDQWDDVADPGIGKVTGFVVNVGSADAQGQAITSLVVSGSNLVTPLDFSVKVAGVATAGTWSAYTWTPATATKYAGTQTIQILKGTRVLAERDVTFYSTSIGGE